MTARRSDAGKGATPKGATPKGATPKGAAKKATAKGTTRRRGAARAAVPTPEEAEAVAERLARIEREGGDGTVELPGGGRLEVSSLDKPFFPEPGYTKGDLLRYYARVAPVLLPAIADRPLVLRRFPNGVEGESFFQQKAPASLPDVVRAEDVVSDAGEAQHRFVGGGLGTLLYTAQLGAISVDPWNARVGSLDRVDFAILDLDPGKGVPFATVVAVARQVRGALEALEPGAALKTSGKRGLHVYVPLAGGATEQEAVALAKRVATRTARACPGIATVARSVKARPAGTVYVDYLQNIVAKPVAAAYCVRATPQATVSTPLSWDELTDDLDPRAFTIATVPARLASRGDLWRLAIA